jgi:hypothetical protein
MATGDLVPDTLWQAIQPLLPTPPPRDGGRARIHDRACLAGIVSQLRTGGPWRRLPTRELAVAARSPACGSGCTTSWGTSWAGRAGWTGRGPAWTGSACAPSGGLPDRPEPDRPRQAREQVPPADRPRRYPAGGRAVGRQPARLAAAGAARRRGCAGQGPAGRPGRPRRRPAKLHLDKGDDDPRCRRALRARGITLRVARRGVESSQRRGRHR